METGSILAGSIVLLSIAVLAARRPAIAFAYSFLLVTFVSKMVSVVYLDVRGPVFAEQLNREIGGSWAAIPFAVVVMLALIPAYFILKPTHSRPFYANSMLIHSTAKRNSSGGVTLGDVALISILVFSLLLYADMLFRGVIPIRDGIERFEYATQYAGSFHHFLFKYGPLIAMWCGVFFVYPALHRESFDWRFLGALILLLSYAFITGHRFSAFYSFSTFFMLPLAALFIVKGPHACEQISSENNLAERRAVRRLLAVLAVVGVVLVVMIILALANSYVNVRHFSPDETAQKLVQRIFIQPSELWYATWERVVLLGQWDGAAAYQFMFNDALEPTRNTGIQYLMLLELGYARTTELIVSMGSQYAGGYPEILFELLGPYAPFVIALLLGVITAGLVRMLLLAIARGHFISVFWIAYVYFAVSLIYIGGMLNSFAVITFWIKMFGMVFSVLVENHLERRGLRLLPWVLIRSNAKIRFSNL